MVSSGCVLDTEEGDLTRSADLRGCGWAGVWILGLGILDGGDGLSI